MLEVVVMAAGTTKHLLFVASGARKEIKPSNSIVSTKLARVKWTSTARTFCELSAMPADRTTPCVSRVE